MFILYIYTDLRYLLSAIY